MSQLSTSQAQSRELRLKRKREVERQRILEFVREHGIQPATLRLRTIRKECLDHYGGQCAECGETILAFLNIDHIDGGGRKHRKANNMWCIHPVLKRQGYPAGYQVLCANCNFRKSLTSIRKDLSTNRVTVNSRMKRLRLRTGVLALYGNSCRCCGNQDTDVLTIDHVHNDGAEDRKGFSNGEAFYRWLRDEPVSPRYQVLCFNCNTGRAANGGVCPHRAPAKNIVPVVVLEE